LEDRIANGGEGGRQREVQKRPGGNSGIKLRRNAVSGGFGGWEEEEGMRPGGRKEPQRT